MTLNTRLLLFAIGSSDDNWGRRYKRKLICIFDPWSKLCFCLDSQLEIKILNRLEWQTLLSRCCKRIAPLVLLFYASFRWFPKEWILLISNHAKDTRKNHHFGLSKLLCTYATYYYFSRQMFYSLDKLKPNT